MLTEREKWLMRKAFFAAHTTSRNFRGWLNDEAADGVTVEMVLAKDAPREDTPETRVFNIIPDMLRDECD